MDKPIYVLKNPDGHFYTGDTHNGCPVFSRWKDQAIELDADEVATEMAADYMVGAYPTSEVIYMLKVKP